MRCSEYEYLIIFVVNDAFYNQALPKSGLPEGVIFGGLREMAEQYPELVKSIMVSWQILRRMQ